MNLTVFPIFLIVLWSFCDVSAQRNGSGGRSKKHGNFFSAIADIAYRAKNTFSEALLPSQDIDRSDERKSLLEKFYDKFSNTPAPEVAAQLRALEEFQFTEPELHQFKEDDQPLKRSSGYLYSAPDNPLLLPSERLELETPEPEETARSLKAEESATNIVRAKPISLSTPGSINIIQEIQIRSTQAPRRKVSGKLRLSPSQSPRVSKQQQDSESSPSLRFSDNPLVAVLGRQVQGQPVEGFPNGLPELTPLGVRITLENMIGPNGEMVMNPIPGVAGTDYPVFSSVPDTGFSCAQQDFPGIYTDTEADCQVFYMCEPNGRSTGFLCPNGTMFNQQYFVCDWWYNLDCAQQRDFYNLNQFLYKENEDSEYEYEDLK